MDHTVQGMLTDTASQIAWGWNGWKELLGAGSDDSSFSKRIKTPAEIEDELEDEYTDTKIKRAHLLGQTHLFD